MSRAASLQVTDRIALRAYAWTEAPGTERRRYTSETLTFVVRNSRFVCKERVVTDVRRVYRVVFFNDAASNEPLLVVDLDPNLELTEKPRRQPHIEITDDRISVRALLLFLLDDTPRTELFASLRVKGGQVLFSELAFRSSARECVLPVAKGVAGIVANQPTYPFTTTPFGKMAVPDFHPRHLTDSGTPEIELPNQNFVAGNERRLNPVLSLAPISNNARLSACNFTLVIPSLNSLGLRTGGELRTFWGRPQRRHVVSSDDAPPRWSLIQLPSRSIGDKGFEGSFDADTLPPTEALFQVNGIPGRTAFGDVWENIRSEYHGALERIKGGNPLSFVPRLSNLNATALASQWVMTYRVQDRHQAVTALGDGEMPRVFIDDRDDPQDVGGTEWHFFFPGIAGALASDFGTKCRSATGPRRAQRAPATRVAAQT